MGFHVKEAKGEDRIRQKVWGVGLFCQLTEGGGQETMGRDETKPILLS